MVVYIEMKLPIGFCRTTIISKDGGPGPPKPFEDL